MEDTCARDRRAAIADRSGECTGRSGGATRKRSQEANRPIDGCGNPAAQVAESRTAAGGGVTDRPGTARESNLTEFCFGKKGPSPEGTLSPWRIRAGACKTYSRTRDEAEARHT